MPVPGRVPSEIAQWQGVWVTDTVYIENDAVSNGGSSYICTVEHTASATTEPGVGASWATYWDLMVSGGSGSDTTAIHDNIASEISAISEKASPVSADLLLIEDSAASNAKKKVQVGNLPGLHNVVEDTTPQLGGDLDADGHSLNDVSSLATSEVKARDANGLKLYDDDGNGIFVDDGGQVGIGTVVTGALLHLWPSAGIDPIIRMQRNNNTDKILFQFKPAGTLGSGNVQWNFGISGSGNDLLYSYFTGSFTKAALTLKESEAVINEDGTDMDFRVESDTNAKAFFVQGSDGNVGIGTSPAISDGTGLHLAGKILRIGTAKTQANAGDTGNTGEICWDASYVYVCTATNTWKRAALSSW